MKVFLDLMFRCSFAILATLAPATFARAGAESAGGGGDAFVLEFVTLGREDAYKALAANALLSKKIDPMRFLKALDHAGITSTIEELFLDGVPKDVINYPLEQRIVISRPRWKTIESRQIKSAIVAHEVFGLLGIDDRHYEISTLLFSNLGLKNAKVDSTSDGPRQPDFSYKTASRLHTNGRAPQAKELLGTWRLVGRTTEPDAWEDFDGRYQDGFDISGLKYFAYYAGWSHDTTLREEIAFAEHVVDFDGPEKLTVSFVRPATNDIADNQGPYEVGLNSTSSAANFSKFGVLSNVLAPNQLSSSYFDFSCRLSGATANRLICAATYQAKGEELASARGQRFTGKIVHLLGYLKN